MKTWVCRHHSESRHFLIALVTGYCTQSDNVDGITFSICLDVTLSTESYLQNVELSITTGITDSFRFKKLNPVFGVNRQLKSEITGNADIGTIFEVLFPR